MANLAPPAWHTDTNLPKTLTSTPISTNIYQVRVGGDAAALKGMMKAVIEADEIALADDASRIIDNDFINGHTMGFEDLAADLRATSWESIERESGLSRGDLKMAALVYIEAQLSVQKLQMASHAKAKA